MGTTFRAPTLVRVPSKGDKWYVYVTKPESLQTSSSKQERRSTGTTDEKVAKERAHDIVKEIYAEFERKLGGVDSVEKYAFAPIKGYPMLNWRGKRPFTSTQFYPAQLKEIHGEEVADIPQVACCLR